MAGLLELWGGEGQGALALSRPPRPGPRVLTGARPKLCEEGHKWAALHQGLAPLGR